MEGRWESAIESGSLDGPWAKSETSSTEHSSKEIGSSRVIFAPLSDPGFSVVTAVESG